MCGLGFGVWGSGCGVWGFGVLSLGFGVWGVGFRDEDSGCMASGLGFTFRGLILGSRVLGFRC